MNCKIITRIARRNNGLSHEDLFAVKDGYGYVENEKEYPRILLLRASNKTFKFLCLHRH